MRLFGDLTIIYFGNLLGWLFWNFVVVVYVLQDELIRFDLWQCAGLLEPYPDSAKTLPDNWTTCYFPNTYLVLLLVGREITPSSDARPTKLNAPKTITKTSNSNSP